MSDDKQFAKRKSVQLKILDLNDPSIEKIKLSDDLVTYLSQEPVYGRSDYSVLCPSTSSRRPANVPRKRKNVSGDSYSKDDLVDTSNPVIIISNCGFHDHKSARLSGKRDKDSSNLNKSAVSQHYETSESGIPLHKKIEKAGHVIDKKKIPDVKADPTQKQLQQVNSTSHHLTQKVPVTSPSASSGKGWAKVKVIGPEDPVPEIVFQPRGRNLSSPKAKRSLLCQFCHGSSKETTQRNKLYRGKPSASKRVVRGQTGESSKNGNRSQEYCIRSKSVEVKRECEGTSDHLTALTDNNSPKGFEKSLTSGTEEIRSESAGQVQSVTTVPFSNEIPTDTALTKPRAKPGHKSDSSKMMVITAPSDYVRFSPSGEVQFSEVIHSAIPGIIQRGSSLIYLLIDQTPQDSSGDPSCKLAYKVDISSSNPFKFIKTHLPLPKSKGKSYSHTFVPVSSKTSAPLTQGLLPTSSSRQTTQARTTNLEESSDMAYSKGICSTSPDKTLSDTISVNSEATEPPSAIISPSSDSFPPCKDTATSSQSISSVPTISPQETGFSSTTSVMTMIFTTAAAIATTARQTSLNADVTARDKSPSASFSCTTSTPVKSTRVGSTLMKFHNMLTSSMLKEQSASVCPANVVLDSVNTEQDTVIGNHIGSELHSGSSSNSAVVTPSQAVTRSAQMHQDCDEANVTSTNSFEDAPLHQWTCSDVARWLTFHGLGRFVPDFTDVDGPSMVELVHSFKANSEIVQSYLRDLGCTLSENLKISALLRALSNQTGF